MLLPLRLAASLWVFSASKATEGWTAMTRNSRHALLRAILACATVALFAILPAPAFAGRLFVTGHDADAHCASADPPQGQCHFVAAAVSYVRAVAPNPAKPLLLLDCTATRELQEAVNASVGPQSATTMCPSKTAAFKSEPLTTDRYSAILVGSSGDMLNINSINTTPDSVAINARAGDISTFFNAGGGVLAFAGDFNADGLDSPPDTYYRFLPIPLGGRDVSAPFTLTPAGIALGLQDSRNGVGQNDDINCCPTHNSFQEPPPGSALQVAERDRAGAPETLFAEGTIGPRAILPGPVTGQVISAPAAKKCVRRKRLKIRISQPAGAQVKKATVYLNGRRVKTLKRKSFGTKRSVLVTLKLKRLRAGKIRVRIVVTTTSGVIHEKTRSYKACGKKSKSKKKSKRKSRKRSRSFQSGH
jgi:hypothetical protein